MVRSGHPQNVVSLLPLEAAEDVLKGDVQGVAHVKAACHVGRRDDHGKGRILAVRVRRECALPVPEVAPALLDLSRFIPLAELDMTAHNPLLSYS